MFILPLIPGGHPSPCIMNNSRKWWSIQGLAPCLLPRPRRPWRSYLWKTIGWIEDDGTCRRYEDNRVPLPSVASNGWDGSGPLALPCSHTRVSSGCAYIGHGVQEICASTLLLVPLCFYCAFICEGRVVRAEEERGRNGTEASRGEERIGKERNRDCPSVSRWYISCLFVLFLSFFFKMRYYHWHFHQTQLAGMISLLVSILF